jgi:SAM-dependent methyltransferase
LPRLAEGLSRTPICGIEPVEALIRQRISSSVTQGLPLLMASGDALPFADNSFDAVCEFGILYHLPEPVRAIQEMLRVARNVVVISDANRLGQAVVPAERSSGPKTFTSFRLIRPEFRVGFIPCWPRAASC